jgi:hypothetical protein
VTGPERASWALAAADLDAELANRRGPTLCAAVVVDANPGFATLVFVTMDGRRAERRMEDPVELIPTVQALSAEVPSTSVGAPDTSAGANAVPRAAESRASSLREPAELTTPLALAAPQPYDTHAIFGAQAGLRAGADHLVSPCIGAFASVLSNRWELGVLGRYEAHYVSTLGDSDRPETSSVVFGVSAGLREPLGKFAVRGGITGLLAALHEDGGNKEGQAEARVGGYVGGVWPERGRFGIRADMSIEMVPYNIGRSQRNATGSSSLPWWGVATTVGLEIR